MKNKYISLKLCNYYKWQIGGSSKIWVVFARLDNQRDLSHLCCTTPLCKYFRGGKVERGRCGEDAAQTVLLLWEAPRVSSPAGLSRTATGKLIGNIDNIVRMTDVK